MRLDFRPLCWICSRPCPTTHSAQPPMRTSCSPSGYSLRFGLTGKPHKLVDHQRLAEIQAAYLERSGFVLMRQAGLPTPGVAPSR